MLRNRYYWATMRADCAMHVQRCNTCQRTAYGPRHHKGIPYVVPISAPFATVAFDIVGPIGIKATRKGNKYILTAIDYFTRYMEAFAIPDETPETVAAAIRGLAILNYCMQVGPITEVND